MADIKDIRGTFDWFTPGLAGTTVTSKGGKSRVAREDGFLIAISGGARTPLIATSLTPAEIAYIVEDNILIYDAVSNPAGGMMVANVRLESNEPGIGKKTRDAYPKSPKKVVDVADAVAMPVPTPEPAEEIWRLEVVANPIGGEEKGDWDVTIELEKDNRPVPDADVRFVCGSNKFSSRTGPDGCWDVPTFTLTEDAYGRAVYDSTLSIHGIPLAGPDKPVPTVTAAPKKGAWTTWNNWVFAVATLFLAASFLTSLAVSYWVLTTPKQAVKSQTASSSNGIHKPILLNQESTAEPTQTSLVGWSTVMWLWIIFAIFLIVWIILIPFCFYDEIQQATLNSYQKSKGSLEAWRHTRKQFRYAVEVVRKNGRNIGSAKHELNGAPVEKPETLDEAKKGISSLSLADIVSQVKKFDFLTDVGVMLFDRFVLGRLLGDKK